MLKQLERHAIAITAAIREHRFGKLCRLMYRFFSSSIKAHDYSILHHELVWKAIMALGEGPVLNVFKLDDAAPGDRKSGTYEQAHRLTLYASFSMIAVYCELYEIPEGTDPVVDRLKRTFTALFGSCPNYLTFQNQCFRLLFSKEHFGSHFIYTGELFRILSAALNPTPSRAFLRWLDERASAAFEECPSESPEETESRLGCLCEMVGGKAAQTNLQVGHLATECACAQYRRTHEENVQLHQTIDSQQKTIADQQDTITSQQETIDNLSRTAGRRDSGRDDVIALVREVSVRENCSIPRAVAFIRWKVGEDDPLYNRCAWARAYAREHAKKRKDGLEAFWRSITKQAQPGYKPPKKKRPDTPPGPSPIIDRGC